MPDWGNLLGSGGHFFAFRSLAYRDMLQILSFQPLSLCVPLRGTQSRRVSINRNLQALSSSVSWGFPSVPAIEGERLSGCPHTSLSGAGRHTKKCKH